MTCLQDNVELNQNEVSGNNSCLPAALKHAIRNPESGNGNGIMEMETETETETEYGICEEGSKQSI